MARSYFVYIMANVARTLYTGVTNDLERPVWQHKTGATPGFTFRYKLHRLVYFEETGDVESAILREKEIKFWVRKKKLRLVESMNPEWRDLAADWYTNADLDTSQAGGHGFFRA